MDILDFHDRPFICKFYSTMSSTSKCFTLKFRTRSRKIKKVCEEGDFSTLSKLLIDGRQDPAIRNNEAIRLASTFGHLHIVLELLKDSRVDPTANHNEALYNACAN